VSIHEIAAGKLAALLSRGKARGLFDCHKLLHTKNVDLERLRLAFVIYGGMNRRDWRSISIEDIELDRIDFKRQLIPTLRSESVAREEAGDLGTSLVSECKDALSSILPFSKNETRFLDRLLDEGKIEPELITDDPDLEAKIRMHPWLLWKAFNVRRYRGL
jgi:hypothetical protein